MIYIDDMAENLQFVLKSKELAKTYGMCRRFGEESYENHDRQILETFTRECN